LNAKISNHSRTRAIDTHTDTQLTLRRPHLPYGYSHKASCAGPG